MTDLKDRADPEKAAMVVTAFTLLELMIYMSSRQDPNKFGDHLKNIISKEMRQFKAAVQDEMLESQRQTTDALAAALNMSAERKAEKRGE